MGKTLHVIKLFHLTGDTVNPGDLLCNIKTDKADVGMDTEEGGILAKILVNATSFMQRFQQDFKMEVPGHMF